jgi:hypothetical protein
MTELLSVAAAGRVIGKSTRTMRRRIDAGLIPAVVENGTLMVRRDELEHYIETLDRPRQPEPRRRRTSVRGYDYLRN